MSSSIGEIIVSAVFLVLLALKLDPLRLLMPNHMQMIVLALVVAVFGVYAGLLFRQKARDEREAFHLHRASAGAYVAGVALLILGIAFQSFSGKSDPWLFYILGGMVVAKMALLVWSHLRN